MRYEKKETHLEELHEAISNAVCNLESTARSVNGDGDIARVLRADVVRFIPQHNVRYLIIRNISET